MSSLKYKGEKYLVISEGGDDYRCFFIESLKELKEEWLDSGSFEDGDWLFEASNPQRLDYTTTREFKPIIVGGKE